MKKIIFTRPDGGVSVVTPIINTHTLVDGHIVPIPENISEQQAIDRALAKLPKDAISPQIVDASAIPSDRSFRDAWKAGNGAVEHDLEKCREIHKSRIREARAPKLAELDVQFMKALERGEPTQAIVEKKQALRDATSDPAIAEASTPDALKSVWPSCLK